LILVLGFAAAALRRNRKWLQQSWLRRGRLATLVLLGMGRRGLDEAQKPRLEC